MIMLYGALTSSFNVCIMINLVAPRNAVCGLGGAEVDRVNPEQTRDLGGRSPKPRRNPCISILKSPDTYSEEPKGSEPKDRQLHPNAIE